MSEVCTAGEFKVSVPFIWRVREHWHPAKLQRKRINVCVRVSIAKYLCSGGMDCLLVESFPDFCAAIRSGTLRLAVYTRPDL